MKIVVPQFLQVIILWSDLSSIPREVMTVIHWDRRFHTVIYLYSAQIYKDDRPEMDTIDLLKLPELKVYQSILGAAQ